ncbi:bifunctional riboflavin kinase/FAD synthetase, partial [Rhodospirillales bacterium]|nr:bifunctional riboflavin kinase/FAD synthetase [Rhodospirillales bacterium]
MRVYRNVQSVAPQHTGAVVAVGNFDGVHSGHRVVIGEAGKIATAAGLKWGVLTFEPHPRNVFQPDIPPFRITPFADKARHIRDLGVDFMIAQKFDMEYSGQSAATFVEQSLVQALSVRHLVAGYDFKFGHKRQGSCETLLAMGNAHGFDFTVVSAASDDGGGLYSSTRARELLGKGDVRAVSEILGRPFEITGMVNHGDARGRTIGFPTANIALRQYIHPAFGVYAVYLTLPDGRVISGVANLGLRPTVAGNTAPRLEVHLFDFEGDIYGHKVSVQFVEMLRAEKKFD